FYLFSLYCPPPLPHLHSFPTRRSSDLELDHALGVLAEKLLQSDRLYAADMAGMVVVDLVGELAPGDTDLLRIDHHDVVAHVHVRSEEHTSKLQSRFDLVCRLLLEKKNK